MAKGNYPKAKDVGRLVKGDPTQDQTAVDVADTPALSKNYAPYAFDRPTVVPLERLYARDNSGGPDWDPDSANFGDGGFRRGQGIGEV